jgi:hypothetical protein
MTTATQARATKSNAKATARSASATARTGAKQATTTAKKATGKATTTARREANKAERGLSTHTRRVVGAAQAEISAVAAQPTRPLYFALGVADRTVAGVRDLPGTMSTVVLGAPARTRARIVDAFATAGDVAERAQRGYTEVAQDGQKLVKAVRRQESTQEAVKYAERAGTRTRRAVSDVEKAVESGAEAATEAVSKLG